MRCSDLARSGVYREPAAPDAEELALMRWIDEQKGRSFRGELLGREAPGDDQRTEIQSYAVTFHATANHLPHRV